MSKPEVKEVEYSTFLKMVDQKKVDRVEIDNTYLSYTLKGKEDVIYQTGIIADSSLVDRLYQKGVTFSQVIPKEMSPLVKILVTWVLLFIVILAIGSLIMRSISKRIGSADVMTFGKSKVKIYVQSERESFVDVAGQTRQRKH